MRKLQSQMDNIFAQTFHDFGTSFGQTGFASSVDLREDKDKYVARIYLPHGDTSRLNAKINNGNLDITINGPGGTSAAAPSENYEQIITLPQPVRADQLQIERKPNMVVITVPKTTASAVAQASPVISPSPTQTVSSSPPGVSENWDQQMIDNLRQMQRRMDQVLQNTFPNDLLSASNALRLGSTVNVEDQKDKYVVHFTLPDRDISNVKVDFKNNELHLTAQEKEQASNTAPSNTAETIERGRYEEMITLPGPVKQSEMKVDRQANAVIVTLPKA